MNILNNLITYLKQNNFTALYDHEHGALYSIVYNHKVIGYYTARVGINKEHHNFEIFFYKCGEDGFIQSKTKPFIDMPTNPIIFWEKRLRTANAVFQSIIEGMEKESKQEHDQ